MNGYSKITAILYLVSSILWGVYAFVNFNVDKFTVVNDKNSGFYCIVWSIVCLVLSIVYFSKLKAKTK